MHKIYNSGINIFGVIPLCQFSEKAGQVTHVFRGTPNSSVVLGGIRVKGTVSTCIVILMDQGDSALKLLFLHVCTCKHKNKILDDLSLV